MSEHVKLELDRAAKAWAAKAWAAKAANLNRDAVEGVTDDTPRQTSEDGWQDDSGEPVPLRRRLEGTIRQLQGEITKRAEELEQAKEYISVLKERVAQLDDTVKEKDKEIDQMKAFEAAGTIVGLQHEV